MISDFELILSTKEILLSVNAKKLVEEAVLEELRGEENNTSLKESWIKLGNQLEIDGVPKDEIATTAADLILTKKSEKFGMPKTELRMSGYFYRIYQSHSWTNQFFARNSSTVPLGEQENSSINSPYYEENKPIIDVIHRLKNHLTDILKIYEESPHMSELDGDVRKQIRQSVHLMNQHIQIAEKIYNRKEKVPQNLQHILLYLLVTEGSVNDAAKAFLQKRVELLELTSKQAGKLQNGTVPDLLPILRPKSRDVAIFLGYYGIQCKYCSSWEVKEQPGSGSTTKVECWSCENEAWVPQKSMIKCSYCQIPIYEENLPDVMAGRKCRNPNCGKVIEYPEEQIRNEFDNLLARMETAVSFIDNKAITQDQRKLLQEKLSVLTA